jgi:hypothetical protein
MEPQELSLCIEIIVATPVVVSHISSLNRSRYSCIFYVAPNATRLFI